MQSKADEVLIALYKKELSKFGLQSVIAPVTLSILKAGSADDTGALTALSNTL